MQKCGFICCKRERSEAECLIASPACMPLVLRCAHAAGTKYAGNMHICPIHMVSGRRAGWFTLLTSQEVVVSGLCAHCNIKGCIRHQLPALTTFYGGRATAAFTASHFYWLQSRARIDLFKSRESRAGKGHPVLAV